MGKVAGPHCDPGLGGVGDDGSWNEHGLNEGGTYERRR